ncbi:MAG: hypothetical protein KatS3mg104_2361 [Phycisphaerae bacterium]|jgi:hypothetical protein|nr:MAG: hypothetical protein KatS3mg104_2361 [Phycisphaerae bacterium]
MKNPRKIFQARGAVGKALVVWLASGSVFAAIIAYLIFSAMGC